MPFILFSLRETPVNDSLLIFFYQAKSHHLNYLLLFVFNYNVEEAFIPELGQHLQHVDADLLWVITQTGTDDAEAIRCQNPAMQPVGLILLVFLIFLI